MVGFWLRRYDPVDAIAGRRDGRPGLSVEAYRTRKVLLIVPDGTRTAPMGIVFKALHGQIGSVTRAFDVLIALGTHQPMSEAAICERLEISLNRAARQIFPESDSSIMLGTIPTLSSRSAPSPRRRSAN